MVIYSKVVVAGSQLNDYRDSLVVQDSMGATNKTSNFNFTLPNFGGIHANDFAVGQDVQIYWDKNISPATTLRFRGTIGVPNYESQDLNQFVKLEGRDYSSILVDATVEPSVYTNLDAGSIARAIITGFTSGLTVGSCLDTGVIINRISFNHIPVFDALNTLADQSNSVFYVDPYLNVNFFQADSVFSGYTLGSGNTTRADFSSPDTELINEVWVYGDRSLTAAPTESGVSNGTGSVITLQYKPSNTQVKWSGTQIVKGGVFNMNQNPPSGTYYLVDYNNQQIIWTSGTAIGNNIPPNGTVSFIDYQRLAPIVKVAVDDVSQALPGIGRRVKVITDKSIKDPRQATNLAWTTLYAYNTPLKIGKNIEVKGIEFIKAGQTVICHFPQQQVNTQQYSVIQGTYTFDKDSVQSDQILTLEVNHKEQCLLDSLKDMMLNIRKLQAQDAQNSDILTRLTASTGSVGVANNYQVLTRSIGSEWYVGSPSIMNGYVGSPGSYYVGSTAKSWTQVSVENYNNTYCELFLGSRFINQSSTANILYSQGVVAF